MWWGITLLCSISLTFGSGNTYTLEQYHYESQDEISQALNKLLYHKEHKLGVTENEHVTSCFIA